MQAFFQQCQFILQTACNYLTAEVQKVPTNVLEGQPGRFAVGLETVEV